MSSPDSLHEPLGELSHLGFRRMLPHPALLPWVQCYWWVECETLPAGGYRERQYPDGGSSLMFDLRPSGARAPLLSITQQLQCQTFSGRVREVGIRFLPGGVFRLLGLAVGELGGEQHEALGLPLAGIDQLYEQLREAGDHHACFQRLEAWLLRRLQAVEPQRDALQWLLPALASGEQSVAALASLVGRPRRALERQFRLEAGISPGQLQRQLRVRRARTLIKARPELTLTEIAQCCGYFDQAHFIRQFRHITDQTPGDYQRRCRAR